MIARAADVASAKVRRAQPGEHQAEWSRLLDQIGATKAFLLNPDKKKAYDQKLSARRAAVAGSAARPTPVASQSPAGTKNQTAQSPMHGVSPAGAAQKPLQSNAGGYTAPFGKDLMADLGPIAIQPAPIVPKSSTAFFQSKQVVVAALILVVGLGVVLLLLYGGGADVRRDPTQPPTSVLARASQAPGPKTSAPPPPPAPRIPPASPSPPKNVSAAETKAQPKPMVGFVLHPEETSPEAETAKPKMEETPSQESAPEEESETPAYEPDLSTEFARAVYDIRLAMADRDLESAAECLEKAKAQVDTEADRAQIERLKTILDNLTQFWGGIQAAIKSLQPAEEIVIRDSRIVVVDSGKDSLIVKVAGRVYRFQLKTLPTSLVMALVNRSFGKDLGSKAIIATFLAVDPGGDRALARCYWLEASSAGIDTGKLLPEIDAMPPVTKHHASKKD